MKRSFVYIPFSAVVLTACAGAATRFYTLEPSANASGSPRSYVGPSFRIDAVHVPASLDRPELVRDVGGGRFIVSDNDHWAAPVGELMRRVLTQDLAAQLSTAAVVYPDAPKPPGSSGLVVDILAVSNTGSQVTMDASWTLIAVPTASGQPVLARRQRSVRVATPSTGAGVSGNAAELSALAALLAGKIAEDLTTASN